MATAQTGEVAVPLNRIEEELSLLLTAGQRAGKLPLLRARMANLMVYCNSAELAAQVDATIPDVIAFHPARVLLLVAERGELEPVTATVKVVCRQAEGRSICAEQVTLRSRGSVGTRLRFAVRQLLNGDLA